MREFADIIVFRVWRMKGGIMHYGLDCAVHCAVPIMDVGTNLRAVSNC
jgi:hypothetical protein